MTPEATYRGTRCPACGLPFIFSDRGVNAVAATSPPTRLKWTCQCGLPQTVLPSELETWRITAT